MNERIKKLVKQAEQYAIDRANEGTDEDFDYSFDDDFQAKFAELIVRECVSALQTKIDDGDGYGSYEAGVHRGFIGARNIIKKHFGVEE